MRVYLFLILFLLPKITKAQSEQWEKYNSSLLIEITRESGIFTCTGVAVNELVVLTAAHCLDGTIKKIRVFTDDLYESTHQGIEIQKYELHPSYAPIVSLYQFDLAKITLNQRLPSFIHLYPIHNGTNLVGNIFRLGFGKRNGQNLRAMVIPILKRLDPQRFVLELFDEYSKSGDSGGPIFIENGNIITILAIHSTLSFGPEGNYSFNPLIGPHLNWIFRR